MFRRNAARGLDLADKLAEYGRVNPPTESADGQSGVSPPPREGWLRPVVWIIGLLAAVAVAVILLGAYRQPELLLNIMGLRYCG